MKKYLVIGNPIEHSFSPLIHNYWMKKYRLVNSVYEKRKVEEKDLKNIVNEIRNDEIDGINVTVPFKKLIIPFLDGLDDFAKKTQSVNTLYKDKNKIIGSNTDGIGFEDTIHKLYPMNDEMINPLEGKYIFVLGAGGVTSSILDGFNRSRRKNYFKQQDQRKS